MSSNAAKMGNVAARATNAAANGTANALSNAAKSDKMPMIIIIVVTILLFIFVILYITFAMKSNNLKGKALMTTPVKVDKSDTPIQISSSDIPKSEVGREFSYSFWIYLENFAQEFSGTGIDRQPVHKMIMYRGNAGDVGSANPLVMMDGESNKMYIVIKTTESSLKDVGASKVADNLDLILKKNYFKTPDVDLLDPTANKHIILEIDYVPLQRWVNVVFVVDNKVLTVYLDGEIYSVKSTDEFKSSRKPHVTRLGKTVTYNLIVEKTDGDLFIGKSRIGQKRTVDGWVGKTEFFNYAMSMEEVKKVYSNGPLPRGLLAMLGLGQYGFRSPVYKMNETVQ